MISKALAVPVTFLCLSAAGLAACRGLPAGPSLSAITLSNVSVQPTVGNPNLCCCRIVGTATNNNQASVHVSIKFSAFDAVRSDPISNIFYFIEDLQPNTTRPIDAPGFVFPCSNIKRLETEVHVSGIAFPPV